MLTAKPILEASGQPLRVFRELVRTDTVTLRRTLEEQISVQLADTWCIRLGLHPVEVYGLKTWLRELGFERV